MKKLLLVYFACTLLVSLIAVAQSTKQDDPATQDTAKTNAQDKQAEKPAKGTTTVTGCLQKGDEAGEFAITGEDGKLWGLRSSTVKLEDHVGHKVTVAGTASGESKAEAKKEKKEGEVENAAQKEEYRDLRVTSLKMISDTCAK
jgi:Protein of unknown function (DUF5818)